MKIENQNKEIVIAVVIDNDSWRIWPNGDPKSNWINSRLEMVKN